LFGPVSNVALELDPWDDARWARGAAALVFRSTFTASLDERAVEGDVRDRLGIAIGTGAA
jgi:hypothetical protein